MIVEGLPEVCNYLRTVPIMPQALYIFFNI